MDSGFKNSCLSTTFWLFNRVKKQIYLNEWLGKATLMQTNPKGTIFSNYRPMTCLPMIWKILTVQNRGEIYYSLVCHELFHKEPKEYQSGTRGTPDLLFFHLFTQAHLLIDGSVEGQYITLGSHRTDSQQGILCWGFKGVQEEIPSEEASTLQIGSVAFPPEQCTSPQLHPCHRLFDQDGHQDSFSPSL